MISTNLASVLSKRQPGKLLNLSYPGPAGSRPTKKNYQTQLGMIFKGLLASPNIFRHSPIVLNPVGDCVWIAIHSNNHAALWSVNDDLYNQLCSQLSSQSHNVQCCQKQFENNAGYCCLENDTCLFSNWRRGLS